MGRELNLLRKEVISLRSEVRVLEKAFTSLQGDQDLVLVKRELAHISTEVEKLEACQITLKLMCRRHQD